jgi:hypothetical protein
MILFTLKKSGKKVKISLDLDLTKDIKEQLKNFPEQIISTINKPKKPTK